MEPSKKQQPPPSSQQQQDDQQVEKLKIVIKVGATPEETTAEVQPSSGTGTGPDVIISGIPADQQQQQQQPVEYSQEYSQGKPSQKIASTDTGTMATNIPTGTAVPPDEEGEYEYEYYEDEPPGTTTDQTMEQSTPGTLTATPSTGAGAGTEDYSSTPEGSGVAPKLSTGTGAGPMPSGKPGPTRIRRRAKGEKATIQNCKIGFMGAGRMTEALVRGLITITKIEPKRIFVSSKTGRSHQSFKDLGCICSRRSYDIFGRFDSDLVFLAFHGFVIRQLYKMGGTRPMALTTNYIPNQRHPVYILSLVGGITCDEIKPCLLNPDNPGKYRIEMHRIMVNYSVAYGYGLSAIDVEPDSKKCGALVRDLLTSISKVEHFPEANMDVACCLGGNGLTFCYYFLGAISDGAFKMGLPKVLATKIAAKILASAASCLLESGKHPSDLRDACTSPSGPAIYGIHVLDRGDCSSGIAAAVEAAYKRIKELSEQPVGR